MDEEVFAAWVSSLAALVAGTGVTTLVASSGVSMVLSGFTGLTGAVFGRDDRALRRFLFAEFCFAAALLAASIMASRFPG
jgi:hypothetical protein